MDDSGIEFWLATITDGDCDLLWSLVIWGDGYNSDEMLARARQEHPSDGVHLMPGQTLSVNGPYITNAAAKQEG